MRVNQETDELDSFKNDSFQSFNHFILLVLLINLKVDVIVDVSYNDYFNHQLIIPMIFMINQINANSINCQKIMENAYTIFKALSEVFKLLLSVNQYLKARRLPICCWITVTMTRRSNESWHLMY